MNRESESEGARAGAPNEALGRERARLGRPDAEELPDLGSLYAAFEAQIAEERGPVAYLRSRSTPLRLAAAALLLAGLAAATLGLAARADLALYPTPRMLLSVGLMAAGFLLSVGLAFRPLSRPALPRPWIRLAIALLPLALGALYVTPAAHVDHPASLQQPGAAALLARALPCLGIGLAVALGMMLLLRAFDRGGSPAALLWASAGGVAANLVLQLHCAVTAREHMLLGHLGVALLALAGAALVERWLARRG